jgi:hypothetical protein
MPCEKYQAALIDLAAGDAQPSSNIRKHLGACALCRAFLEQEQLLVASIDAGLRRTANVPLPLSFLQRFAARLAQEAPVNRSWNANWIYLAAAAVLIVLMLPMLRTRRVKERASVVSPQTQVAKRPTPQVSPQATPLETARASLQAQHLKKRTPPQQSPSTFQPEVLVPPEEREAFTRFLTDLNGQQNLAVVLVKPVIALHEQATEPVQTPEIEIAALAVQPLEDRDEK